MSKLDERLKVIDETASKLKAPIPDALDKQGQEERKLSYRADRPPAGGAWICMTPNDEFWGQTCGCSFKMGICVIGLEDPEAEWKAWRLESDHGYEIMSVDETKRAEVERKLAEAKPPSRSWVERLFNEKPLKVIAQ